MPAMRYCAPMAALRAVPRAPCITCCMPLLTFCQSDGLRRMMSGIGSGSTGFWPSMVLARCGRYHLPLLATNAVAWASCKGVACM
ncbi:hypothetical protein D3C78_1703020 [compost metagenome]